MYVFLVIIKGRSCGANNEFLSVCSKHLNRGFLEMNFRSLNFQVLYRFSDYENERRNLGSWSSLIVRNPLG